MKSFKPVLSSLKLRGSYGEVGNQDVPLSAYIPTLTVSNPEKEGNYWLINKQYVPYISSSPALVDPTLTWETVSTLDFAIDAGLFDDKLNFTAEWYRRKTMDMLSPGETVPSTIGASAAKRNLANLKQMVLILSVSYRHTFSNYFPFQPSGQFTDYKSKVTKYPSAAIRKIQTHTGKAKHWVIFGAIKQKDFSRKMTSFGKTAKLNKLFSKTVSRKIRWQRV